MNFSMKNLEEVKKVAISQFEVSQLSTITNQLMKEREKKDMSLGLVYCSCPTSLHSEILIPMAHHIKTASLHVVRVTGRRNH